MARKKNLALVGGNKKQMQSEKAHSWTGDKEREFLSILGETCNVTRACEVVGMSTAGAYKHRRKNAVFRAAWAETMSTADQQLELVLLDRTFNGTEKVIQRHDGTEDRMREYPNQLGLRLLQTHRDTASIAEVNVPTVDDDELRERLIKKLLRLKKRLSS